jgi:hypothetical protein
VKLRGILALALALATLTACDTHDGAGSADAAVSDFHAPDASPRDAETDAASDANDASLCCPVDPPSNACDCTRMGGTPDANGRCPRAPCDLPQKFAPYVDENGCPALKVVPNDGTVRCNAAAPRDAGSDADAASTEAGIP